MSERLLIEMPGRLQTVEVAPSPCEPAGAARRQERMQAAMTEERGALQGTQQALLQAMEEVAELRARVLHQAEKQILDLAIRVAEKVLMQTVQAGRYEIEPIVQEVLQRVGPRQNVIVHLNPADLARCPAASGGNTETVRFVADPAVPPAGCMVETAQGAVETSVDQHLRQVVEALQGQE